ncbi:MULTISPECIES: T9SS-dependent choice-of-anchor J family protein [Chryseobacterium]|uniref:Secreted protein (Por secretion system target) n=1 Tax=Chryseobacterium geocarposphaerae TaxID=1416776 RepID=A0ABU1LCB0_9FLAO|nr:MULTISPECIES: choice-of-anchor J domain-containing protein [Chryseobacterium]MDR6404361.1 hypothetical protein [Chryseobacterium geocarposphaerae]MDR6699776.1 hypothetical protein [Chryseobacterium ginsenosidimutans]
MMKSIFLFCTLTVASLSAQTTIFDETFDTPVSDQLPPNWSTQNLNNGDITNRWQSGTVSLAGPMGFSGDVAVSFGDNNSPFDNLLVSPAITLPTGSSTLTYKVAAYESPGIIIPNNIYNVYVLPASGTFTTALTPVFTETVTTGNTALEKTIDLSSFAGQTVILYFRHYGTELQYLFLDDVKVTSPTILATSEVGNKIQIGIYPNPATDFITIKSKSDVSKAEIFDVSGRKMTSKLEKNTIDVRHLQSGSYIISIETKEGKTSAKFIKK